MILQWTDTVTQLIHNYYVFGMIHFVDVGLVLSSGTMIDRIIRTIRRDSLSTSFFIYSYLRSKWILKGTNSWLLIKVSDWELMYKKVQKVYKNILFLSIKKYE